MNDAPSPTRTRQAEIIRRLQAGESGRHIAREVGVSPQYVSQLFQRLKREGADLVLATGRGRPRNQELTPEQAASLRARLLTPRPEGTAVHGGRWTALEVRDWFKKTHTRPFSLYELRRFCFANHLRTAGPVAGAWSPDEDDADPSYSTLVRPSSGMPTGGATVTLPSAFPRRRRGRPRKGEEGGAPQTMTTAMLEQMVRSNAEVAQQMARLRQEAAAPAAPAPVRLGPKLGRNDPCPLDPGKKFKHCCGGLGESRCPKAMVPPAAPPGDRAEPKANGPGG